MSDPAIPDWKMLADGIASAIANQGGSIVLDTSSEAKATRGLIDWVDKTCEELRAAREAGIDAIRELDAHRRELDEARQVILNMARAFYGRDPHAPVA